VIELLEAEGFSQTEDAPLFEYLAVWMENNQFMQATDEEKFQMFKETYGFLQFLEFGEILPEEDSATP